MERIAGRRRRVGVLSWGSNPLRRKVDRVEAGIFAGLLVTFLIGAPLLAVAAGWWEHGAAAAEQRSQRSVHLVTAVLPQDVPDRGRTGTWDAGAVARWTVSDGRSCVGLVLDTVGAKEGSRLPMGVDGSGREADPPLTGRDVRSRVITAAALAPAAFAITLLAVAIWLRWLLNRRRWRAGARPGQTSGRVRARTARLGPVTKGSAMTVVFISGPVAIIMRDREQRGEQATGLLLRRRADG